FSHKNQGVTNKTVNHMNCAPASDKICAKMAEKTNFFCMQKQVYAAAWARDGRKINFGPGLAWHEPWVYTDLVDRPTGRSVLRCCVFLQGSFILQHSLRSKQLCPNIA